MGCGSSKKTDLEIISTPLKEYNLKYIKEYIDKSFCKIQCKNGKAGFGFFCVIQYFASISNN